jgi:hypothetical protein
LNKKIYPPKNEDLVRDFTISEDSGKEKHLDEMLERVGSYLYRHRKFHKDQIKPWTSSFKLISIMRVRSLKLSGKRGLIRRACSRRLS